MATAVQVVCVDSGVVDEAAPAGGNTLQCRGRDWPEGFFYPRAFVVVVDGQSRHIMGNSDRVLRVDGGWARPISAGAEFRIYVGPDLTADTEVYGCGPGAVAAGQWVYITATGNQVAPARADAAATMPAIGVVEELLSPALCRVRLRGPFQEPSRGFAASDDVFVSDTVAGAPTNVPPVAGIVQKVAEVAADDGTTTTYELA